MERTYRSLCDALATLNANELTVLRVACANALSVAGGDFGFSDDITDACGEQTAVNHLSAQQVGGYLSALSAKGLLIVHEPHQVNDDEWVHQVSVMQTDDGPAYDLIEQLARGDYLADENGEDVTPRTQSGMPLLPSEPRPTLDEYQAEDSMEVEVTLGDAPEDDPRDVAAADDMPAEVSHFTCSSCGKRSGHWSNCGRAEALERAVHLVLLLDATAQSQQPAGSCIHLAPETRKQLRVAVGDAAEGEPVSDHRSQEQLDTALDTLSMTRMPRTEREAELEEQVARLKRMLRAALQDTGLLD